MATDGLELRTGDARDAAAVDALMVAAFDPRYGEAWSRGQVLGVLAMPGMRLTLAIENGDPAGFALVRTVIDEAELLLLAVAPGRRRRGIGDALLGAALADGAEAGLRRIFLEVRAGNDAVRLYARHGFARNGTRRGYYQGTAGSFDAHSYSRPVDLPPPVASQSRFSQ